MPYSVLLQPQARSAVGVDVRGNIVVVDEAHNLIEAINELHSVQLTVAQIRVAQRQLSEYLERFKLKLAGKNLYYVNVLLTILQSLVRYATEVPEDELLISTSTPSAGTKPPNSDEIFRISDFMFRARLENANLFKVGRFIVRSEIARKVRILSHNFLPLCFFDLQFVGDAGSTGRFVAIWSGKRRQTRARRKTVVLGHGLQCKMWLVSCQPLLPGMCRAG